MRVVYFGTPAFAARALDYLFKHHIEIVAVISKPDRPAGRSSIPLPTPVKVITQSFNPSLPLYQPEVVSAPEFASTLRALNADLFVVVAYGEILKQHLLEMPSKGCINLHASLLPSYRGAAPIQRSIIEGKTESGVTILHMVKKMDAGEMIEKAVVPIGPETTFEELDEALCEAGKEALLKVIRAFEKGSPPSTPQDDSQATFAPKIELEDCEIRWDRPAQEIHNLIRGVNPHPGAWCYILVKGEKKRLKINRSRLIHHEDAVPGTLLNAHQTKGNLLIATGCQALELVEVRLEGKKNMSSEELARGIPRLQISFKLP